MKFRCAFAAAFLAALLSPLTSRAALPGPGPASRILAGLSQPATAQAPVMQAGDFDALSVTDPLYREGSLSLLEQEVKSETEAKKKAPVMRDAPVSKKKEGGAPAAGKELRLKKTRAKKPLHADPLKEKRAL